MLQPVLMKDLVSVYENVVKKNLEFQVIVWQKKLHSYIYLIINCLI